MNTFSELTLQTSLHNNLKRNCFTQPTPVQAQAIPPALEGSDVVATAQTGTGKTLAFLVPTIEKLIAANAAASKSVHALILAPTRELALQIADSFEKLSPTTGLRSAVVVGGLSEQKQLNDLRRGAQVVIATPGRLEDFMNRRLISLGMVSIAILDEADRMLDMGFLPAIEKILSALPAKRQSLFFSATMDRTVERLIQRHSNNPVQIRITGTMARTPDQVDLHVYEVENDQRIGLLRHMLTQEEGSFLVFSRTKHGTDRLAKKLATCGIRAVAMHGDRTQNQRNQALAGFRDGRYRVLVATDVAARGIHVDSVAHVVNFDLPQAPEDFIHRVGRTGRAGQRGCASTFISKSERGDIRRIERECKVSLQRREVSPEILNELAVIPQRDEFRPAQRETAPHATLSHTTISHGIGQHAQHDRRAVAHRFAGKRADRSARPAHRGYAHA
ncbi:MAG TPA: DEAD/DEAH box helicase [Bryobacteraceae bacterium]|jgi:ATP-dependent RNA helicase RhlE|nr:DEAD/DEAH box helicase [Bryobacteraceae bacterium]